MSEPDRPDQDEPRDDAEAQLRAALVRALARLRDDPDAVEEFVERLRDGLTTDALARARTTQPSADVSP